MTTDDRDNDNPDLPPADQGQPPVNQAKDEGWDDAPSPSSAPSLPAGQPDAPASSVQPEPAPSEPNSSEPSFTAPVPPASADAVASPATAPAAQAAAASESSSPGPDGVDLAWENDPSAAIVPADEPSSPVAPVPTPVPASAIPSASAVPAVASTPSPSPSSKPSGGFSSWIKSNALLVSLAGVAVIAGGAIWLAPSTPPAKAQAKSQRQAASDDGYNPDARGAQDLQTAMRLLGENQKNGQDRQKQQDSALVTLANSVEKLRQGQDDLVRRIDAMMARNDSEAARLAAALSPELRGIYPDAARFLDDLALQKGIYAWEDVNLAFSAWIQGKLPTANAGDITKLYEAAHVRREQPSDAMLALQPALVRQRDSAGIPADDLRGIYRLVWQQRASLGGATAGQLLGLAQVVGRSAGASGGGAEAVAGQGEVRLGSASAASLPIGALVSKPVIIGYTKSSTDYLPATLAASIPYWDGALDLTKANAAYAAAYRASRGSEAVIAISRASYTTYGRRDIEEALLSLGAKTGVIPPTTLTLDATLGTEDQRQWEAAVLLGTIVGEQHRAYGMTDRAQEAVMRQVGQVSPTKPPVQVARLGAQVPLADFLEAMRGVSHSATALPTDTAARLLDQNLVSTWSQASEVVPAEERPAVWPTVVLNAAGQAVAHPEGGQAGVVQSVWAAAVAATAERVVAREVEQRLLPRYGALFDVTTVGDWSQVTRSAIRSASTAMADSISTSGVRIGTDNASGIRNSLQSLGLSTAEKSMAEQAVVGSVKASIDRLAPGRQANLVRLAREHVEARAGIMVVSPFTDERLARFSEMLTREALDIMTGRRRAAIGAASVSPGPSGLTGSGNIRPVGRIVDVTAAAGPASTRQFTIPGGSFAQGFALNGAVLTLGAPENEEITIHVMARWNAAGASTVMTQALRVTASVEGMLGPDRARLMLKKAFLVLPASKKIIKATATGRVVAGDGINGLPGEYDGHWDRILPYAGGEGLLNAAIAAVAPNNSTTTINVGTTTTTQSSDASTGQKALAGFAQGVQSPITNYGNKVVALNAPSITVKPGQFVHVVSSDDIVFDVAPDEYEELTQRAGTGQYTSFKP